MDTHVLSSLDNLETRINNVLTSLTTSPTAAGAPAATLALLDADDALSSALETLRTHQANYHRILKLRAEAEQLEERVKGIVRDIEGVGKEISTVCGDEVEDESDTDDDSDDGSDYASDGADRKNTSTRRGKEVDYKLLLDFARRISRYNQQAAADAAAGAQVKKRLQEDKQADRDVEMSGVNGEHTEGDNTQSVGAVTKDATAWLDESANMARAMYMMPFPAEDRIRLGLMAQVQLAATERGIDPEREVERLVREAEGLGIAEPVQTHGDGENEERNHAAEASKAAEHVGSTAVSSTAPAPAPKPKATLDLDLYDPDDDDI
ncbi:hypothetical protein ANI_1_1162074 [Paecilomyces variotii No. 5]|uniref:Mediator of RNA polymerase II transcription subunit 4 n=1 Tax=Byssochlamys spectabilis (strain No. 5 / NBRC 109023) TaxID=1356009 RepID=V5FTD3_BYSSN|nr:hypothetical protein ANI_1_1162074 [Paecilomyces variotii No. 5]